MASKDCPKCQGVDLEKATGNKFLRCSRCSPQDIRQVVDQLHELDLTLGPWAAPTTPTTSAEHTLDRIIKTLSTGVRALGRQVATMQVRARLLGQQR